MRKTFRAIAAIAALTFGAVSAHAQSPTSTYRGLSWNFTANQTAFNGCSLLFLDATGVPGSSVYYSLYGQLFCPSFGGSYNSHGSGFFDQFNQFNIMITLGTGYKLTCALNGSSFSSSNCAITDNLGNRTGTASLFLR